MTALAPSLPLPSSRLVRAEILKLRSRSGLAITTLLLTVAATAVTYGILVLLHAVNPAHHGPAGGVNNLGDVLWLLSTLSAVTAVLVGTTAAAGDLSAGVFRELVVTGRSRVSLFLARIPGGLAVLLVPVAVAYVIAAVASVALAAHGQAPTTGSLLDGGVWLVLSTTVYFLLGLGIGSLVGSRTTTIVILLAWRLAVMPIVLSLTFLGGGRKVLADAGLNSLVPNAFAQTLRINDKLVMSTSLAVLVIVIWTAVALCAGAWRTATRDA